MTLQTKYVHFRRAVAVGQRVDGWRVAWAGGWDRGKVYFVAMLVRVAPEAQARRRGSRCPAVQQKP